MPDPDPNKESQQPVPPKSGGRSLPPDPEIPRELQELARKLDATDKDQPAVPSNLHTHEEVEFELELEELRFKREERKSFVWSRWGFVVLLGLLTLIALVSAAVIVVGLSSGESHFVLPALAPLSASGATGALLWRSYTGRFAAGIGRGFVGDRHGRP